MSTVSKTPMKDMRRLHMLVIVVVLALGVIAVLLFEIWPMMRSHQRERNLQAAAAGRPTFKPQAVASNEVRFDGILDKAKDNTPVPEDDWDEARMCLTRHVNRVTADDLAKDSMLVNFRDFAKYSQELRGRTVRLVSSVRWYNELKISSKEALAGTGAQWIYRAYLVDPWGIDGYVVDLLEPFPAGEEGHPMVMTDAVFLKMGTITNRKDQVQAIPYFVGRRLEPFKPVAVDTSLSIGVYVGVIGVTAIVIVGILTYGIWSGSRGRPPVPVPVMTKKDF